MVELIDIFRSVRQFAAQLFGAVDNFIASFGLDPDKLAQVGHISVSYGLTFTAFVVGWCFNVWWVGFIVIGLKDVLWVYWKEYKRDPKPPENAPFWPSKTNPFTKSGLFDATMYWTGSGLALYVAAAIGMAFPR